MTKRELEDTYRHDWIIPPQQLKTFIDNQQRFAGAAGLLYLGGTSLPVAQKQALQGQILDAGRTHAIEQFTNPFNYLAALGTSSAGRVAKNVGAPKAGRVRTADPKTGRPHDRNSERNLQEHDWDKLEFGEFVSEDPPSGLSQPKQRPQDRSDEPSEPNFIRIGEGGPKGWLSSDGTRIFTDEAAYRAYEKSGPTLGLPAPKNLNKPPTKSLDAPAKAEDNLHLEIGDVGPTARIAPNGGNVANPFNIRFTQATASPNLSSGSATISDLTNELAATPSSVGKIPALEVVEYKGHLYSLNNRRLVAFQQSGMQEIPINRLSLSDPDVLRRFWKQVNPGLIDDGTKIIII